MNIRKCDVLTLKMTYILLKYYKYHFVVVQDDDKTIWLSNPDNANYPLIRISNSTSGEGYFKREYIATVKNSISKLLNNNMKLLEIYTNDESWEFNQKEDDLIWCTNIKAEIPDKLFALYPLLAGAFDEIDDPEKEYEKLREAIRNWQNSQKITTEKKKHFPLITWSVGLICIVVYLLSWILNRTFNEPLAVAVVLGAYYKAFVVGLNQYWRFLTSGFVHVELWHLVINVFSLFNIGAYLELVLDRIKYLSVLLTAIIFGNLLVFIGSGNIVSLGISGGLYGLLAVLFVYYFKSGMIRNRRLRNNIIMIMAVNIIVSLSPGISFLGHLGGFIAGLVLGVIMLFDHQRIIRTNMMIAGVILITVTIYLAVTNRALDFYYIGTDNKIVEIYDKLGLNNYGSRITDKMNKFYGGK